MTDDTPVDAYQGAGVIQGAEVTNDEGMSLEDAVTSSYDDHDRHHNGIAEGERENLGRHLKGHADAAGVSVISGLNSLLDSAVGLRGDQATRRQVIGHLIDNFDVRLEPTAEPAPAVADPAVAQQQAMTEVADFIAANPIAQDEQIQDATLYHLNNMQAQGFPPDLRVALALAGL